MENLIVIPTYNESENVKLLAKAIFDIHPNTDILFLDDNSPDGTGKIIDEMSKEDPRIKTMHRSGRLGLASAYITGFKWALEKDYKYICGMDCDFSHDPNILPEMFAQAKTHDYTIASRYIKGGGTRNWPLFRKTISYCGNMYARIVLGNPIHDLTGAFVCWKRETLEGLGLDDLTAKGYIFTAEIKHMAYKKGFKFKEVPLIFEDRVLSKSKMSGGIFLEGILRVIKLRLSLIS